MIIQHKNPATNLFTLQDFTFFMTIDEVVF